MPKVGNKEFSYDESGYAEAKSESQATGLPIEQGYRHGGPIVREKTEVVPSGSGAARPQKFRITIGG